MSHTPERRAEQRDECEIATRIELATRLAVAVALTNISPGGVRLRVADGLHPPDDFDLIIPLMGRPRAAMPDKGCLARSRRRGSSSTRRVAPTRIAS